MHRREPDPLEEASVELTDRVALITGGATGIGRATALALARGGAHIAVNYARSAAEANSTSPTSPCRPGTRL